MSYYPAPNINTLADNFVNSGSTGKYRYEQEMARYDRVIDQNVDIVVTHAIGRQQGNHAIGGEPAAIDDLLE